MWWYFIKIAETDRTVTYSYGFESREVTGVFEFDKETGKTTNIKNAYDPNSEDGIEISSFTAYQLVKKYGAPDKEIIAYG